MKIAELGTILSIWAHPDDESWSAAGIMMAARLGNQRVVCVTATRGEQGVQNEARWPQASLGHIREQEMAASLKVMDIPEHYWLDYLDGQCATIPVEKAAQKLLPIIREVQPDTILTFGPDGVTGHDDHKSVSHWVDVALAQLTGLHPAVYHAVQSKEWYERLGKDWDEQFDVFFNIDEPPLVPEAKIDLFYQLPEELIDRKLDALRAQPSQTEGMFTVMSPEELRDTASRECFMRVHSIRP